MVHRVRRRRHKGKKDPSTVQHTAAKGDMSHDFKKGIAGFDTEGVFVVERRWKIEAHVKMSFWLMA